MNYTGSTYYIKNKYGIFKRIWRAFQVSLKSVGEFYELDDMSWYQSEIDDDGNSFIWSKPTATIKLFNVKNIRLIISDPIGRNVCIKFGNVEFNKKLVGQRTYIFNIETFYQSEICISVDEPFTPVDDVRELGLNFKKIEIV
jgi:hypothetical protein